MIEPLVTGSAMEAGYRWVAEWEPHEATWIAWPHNPRTWPGLLHAIPPITERMIRTLAEVEKVHVLGGPPSILEQATMQLGDANNVYVHDIPTNDCWIRDYGPTFLLNENGTKLGAVLWRFNAWGEKYHPHDDDTNAAASICKLSVLQSDTIQCRLFVSNMIAEGGGIETDGEGTLLTTSSCLLASTRNPNWSRQLVEAELKRMLAVRKVLWIDGGELAGDDTDSHIDQLVRFVRPGLVVAAVSYNLQDSNASKLAKQYEALKKSTDANNRPLEIVPLVTPPPRYIQGKRVPESYCNFYIANEIVIVPMFGFRETDESALKILQDLFPDRTMIGIDASEFIFGLGAFHCATQQQPRLKASPTELPTPA